MTRLREALDGIAAEAPLVNLADVAVAGHRRRRRATAVLAAAATVAVVGAASIAVAPPWQRADRTATPQGVDTVPDLPDGAVGPIAYAFQTPCEKQRNPVRIDCGTVEWRVVTRSGRTYRVPQALFSTAKDHKVPVAISRDGRMLAYYSRQAQAHVVRDLVGGTQATSPVTVKEERISMGSTLALSDDGRYLIFDPREGTKDPGLLIDVRTGKSRPVDGNYEVVSIKGGVAVLVRYVKTDLWRMPVTGGGRPVRFDGKFIMFSEIAPDGRTVAAFEFSDYAKRRLTVLDAKSGQPLRKVPIRGLPAGRGGAVMGTALWTSGSEVAVVYQSRDDVRTYAVNVKTGQAHQVARYPGVLHMRLVLPGVASQ
ncbi:hypothetical protein [Nonomuraea cavernae]|uniref:WD40 repeat domain-containing protein n=1 Tax=Nonomuraea cavernae TaxID=2045107 RepID=A0A917Z8N5_9ACTN|nr:hypothetical protein [Nonomuraea cavernae]MCA2185658.1 hypothetical protein [Nonomuraea cavernae]GGO78188.1 hypothetical protein GCM10012289_59610 [Nonomuraea cavernae]